AERLKRLHEIAKRRLANRRMGAGEVDDSDAQDGLANGSTEPRNEHNLVDGADHGVHSRTGPDVEVLSSRYCHPNDGPNEEDHDPVDDRRDYAPRKRSDRSVTTTGCQRTQTGRCR